MIDGDSITPELADKTKAVLNEMYQLINGSPLFSHATKREVFAAMAMQAIIGCPDDQNAGNWSRDTTTDTAEQAVAFADELIKVLSEEPT